MLLTRRDAVVDDVKVGLIGCGGNGRGHAKTVNALDGADVVAVCDMDGERAKLAAEEVQAEAYTDMHKLLERDDLDAVYLSLPVFAHGEPEQAVIDRGLPFLVEKPVARDMATAKRIEKQVADTGLMTAVGYQLRYGESATKTRELLRDKTVCLVVGKYWSGSGRASKKGWQTTMAQSGGQLLEQATHTLDMMRYLCGDVAEVSCMSATRTLDDIDCPDTHVVQLKFASGALGVITTYWDYELKDWSNANVVEIVAEQTLVEWRHNALTVTQGGQTTQEPLGAPGIDAVFVEAVRTGDGSKILSPYADGVKSLALSLAAIESADTGKPVALA